MVARQQVVSNSYLWPDGTVPYQQWGTASPTGDRPDCSGYVGGCCWDIPVEVNTVSLVTDGWMYEIPASELQPGDALGLCGPGTAGDNGHIQLFLGWDGTGVFIAEQTGGGPGPHHHTVKRITPGYRAYRFKGITGAAPPTPGGDDDMLTPQEQHQIAQDAATLVAVGYDRFGNPTGAGSDLIQKFAGAAIEARLSKQMADSFTALGALVKASAGGGMTPEDEAAFLAKVEAAAERGAEAGAPTEAELVAAAEKGANLAEDA